MNRDIFYENSCYEQLVWRLLIENRLRLSEIWRNLRIGNRSFYIFAIKKSAEFSSERTLEDLTILYEDIQTLEGEENKELKETLSEVLCVYIDRTEYYYKDNRDVIAFSEKVKKELNNLW